MRGSEEQWVAALVLGVTALFVAAGLPVAPEWRHRLKIAAIGGFILALIAVVVKITHWLVTGSR